MAQNMEPLREPIDREQPAEEQISPVKARQGGTGKRILTLLIVALVLAFLVWIPVEIWGQRQADEVAPQQPGQQLQSEQPASQNGKRATTTPPPVQ
ncbi:hypothetical protein [Rhizobium sp. Root1220]|uniref:hypothetical protein n=1 Tax=Rhizobium sp. Root1220 TaxID=1736432 RepID=UPI0006FBF617|nr:hypothetical protein [Rhizobium sp. Root1220]KQV84527.1 hypothetical protein ASC90_01970 [Rhizobium sp. Root1220]